MSLQVVFLIVLSLLLVLITSLLAAFLWRDQRRGRASVCMIPYSGSSSQTQSLRIAEEQSRKSWPLRRRLLDRIFFLTPERIVVMSAGSLLMATFFGFAINRDNGNLQVLELESYAWMAGLPRQVMQVHLAQYRSFSQYNPTIVSPQAGNFGQNACGLIAPAQAVVVSYNPRLAGTNPGFNAVFNLMNQVRAHATRPGGAPTYQGATGIQPSDLVHALRASPIGEHFDITSRNSWSLAEMYQSLLDGRIIIVDLLVQQQDEIPSTLPDTFAHYARVLGIDLDRRQIFLDNTLGQQDGKSYWNLPLEEFMEVWQHPETQATIRPSQVDPSIQEENVNHWALVMGKK